MHFDVRRWRADPVEHGQGGVRRKAREEHGLDVLAPPGEQIGEVGPVGLVLHPLLHRIRAGHDEEVRRVLQQGLDRQVVRGDPSRHPLSPRHARQGIATYRDHLGSRARLEQVQELSFGGVEGAVGHVVHERTGPVHLIRGFGERGVRARRRGLEQPHGH